MSMLWISVAVAETVTIEDSTEWAEACGDLAAGDTLLLDTTGGKFSGKCTVSVPNVTIAPIEGLDYADVETLDLQESASGATVRQLRFQSGATYTLLGSAAEGVTIEDVVFMSSIGNGLVVTGGDATVSGLQGSGYDYAVVVLTPSWGVAELTVKDATITDSSTGFGAFASGDTTGVLNIEGGTFSANDGTEGESSIGVGGVIQATGNVDVHVDGALFVDNKADWGGVVGSFTGDREADLEIQGSVFLGNEAEIGGAVYWEFGQVRIEDSLFCGNRAATGSALVSTSGANTTMDRVTFQANEGTEGTLLLEQGSHTYTHLSVVENTDELTIGLGQSAGLYLANSLFVGNGGMFNEAYTGGYNAFFDNEGPLDVLDGELTAGEAGFLSPYDPSNCDHLPYISDDSILVDAGKPGTSDPDGSDADIGAFWAGAGTNEDLPGDTGEDTVLEQSRWLSGGCATAPVYPVGSLLLLALIRRRKSTEA